MKSTENLDRIVKALEKLPDNYETEHALKQNGYVEGVCDSINTVVKLFIHNVSNTEGKSKAEITYEVIQNLKQMLINDGDEELANRL
jgi:hypothetical protein